MPEYRKRFYKNKKCLNGNTLVDKIAVFIYKEKQTKNRKQEKE
jgi:hypothetical protein